MWLRDFWLRQGTIFMSIAAQFVKTGIYKIIYKVTSLPEMLVARTQFCLNNRLLWLSEAPVSWYELLSVFFTKKLIWKYWTWQIWLSFAPINLTVVIWLIFFIFFFDIAGLKLRTSIVLHLKINFDDRNLINFLLLLVVISWRHIFLNLGPRRRIKHAPSPIWLVTLYAALRLTSSMITNELLHTSAFIKIIWLNVPRIAYDFWLRFIRLLFWTTKPGVYMRLIGRGHGCFEDALTMIWWTGPFRGKSRRVLNTNCQSWRLILVHFLNFYCLATTRYKLEQLLIRKLKLDALFENGVVLFRLFLGHLEFFLHRDVHFFHSFQSFFELLVFCFELVVWLVMFRLFIA